MRADDAKRKTRYVMGTPPQLLQMIGLGMDMFDCVMPTVSHATRMFLP